MVEEKFEMEELPAQNVIRFKKPLVEFKYENDPDWKKYIEQLQAYNLLTLVPLDEEVNAMMQAIQVYISYHLVII